MGTLRNIGFKIKFASGEPAAAVTPVRLTEGRSAQTALQDIANPKEDALQQMMRKKAIRFVAFLNSWHHDNLHLRQIAISWMIPVRRGGAVRVEKVVLRAYILLVSDV